MRILKTIEVVKGDVTETIPYTGSIICNKCRGILWEDRKGTHKRPTYFRSLKEWKGVSRWEKEEHEFHLCQECYAEMVESFKLPPDNPSQELIGVHENV